MFKVSRKLKDSHGADSKKRKNLKLPSFETDKIIEAFSDDLFGCQWTIDDDSRRFRALATLISNLLKRKTTFELKYDEPLIFENLTPEVNYAFKHAVAGLLLGCDESRPGYASALCELITHFELDFIVLTNTINEVILKSKADVSTEKRYIAFIFAAAAVVRTGVAQKFLKSLNDSNSCSYVNIYLINLLDPAILSTSCACAVSIDVVIQLLEFVEPDIFFEHFLPTLRPIISQDPRTINPNVIYLIFILKTRFDFDITKEAPNFWTGGDFLHPLNIPNVVLLLKKVSNFSNMDVGIHPVWDLVFTNLKEKAQFSSFFNELFGDEDDSTMLMKLRILQRFCTKIPSEHLETIFNTGTLGWILRLSMNKNEPFNADAIKVLNSIIEICRIDRGMVDFFLISLNSVCIHRELYKIIDVPLIETLHGLLESQGYEKYIKELVILICKSVDDNHIESLIKPKSAELIATEKFKSKNCDIIRRLRFSFLVDELIEVTLGVPHEFSRKLEVGKFLLMMIVICSPELGIDEDKAIQAMDFFKIPQISLIVKFRDVIVKKFLSYIRRIDYNLAYDLVGWVMKKLDLNVDSDVKVIFSNLFSILERIGRSRVVDSGGDGVLSKQLDAFGNLVFQVFARIYTTNFEGSMMDIASDLYQVYEKLFDDSKGSHDDTVTDPMVVMVELVLDLVSKDQGEILSSINLLWDAFLPRMNFGVMEILLGVLKDGESVFEEHEDSSESKEEEDDGETAQSFSQVLEEESEFVVPDDIVNEGEIMISFEEAFLNEMDDELAAISKGVKNANACKKYSKTSSDGKFNFVKEFKNLALNLTNRVVKYSDDEALVLELVIPIYELAREVHYRSNDSDLSSDCYLKLLNNFLKRREFLSVKDSALLDKYHFMLGYFYGDFEKKSYLQLVSIRVDLITFIQKVLLRASYGPFDISTLKRYFGSAVLAFLRASKNVNRKRSLNVGVYSNLLERYGQSKYEVFTSLPEVVVPSSNLVSFFIAICNCIITRELFEAERSHLFGELVLVVHKLLVLCFENGGDISAVQFLKLVECVHRVCKHAIHILTFEKFARLWDLQGVKAAFEKYFQRYKKNTNVKKSWKSLESYLVSGRPRQAHPRASAKDVPASKKRKNDGD